MNTFLKVSLVAVLTSPVAFADAGCATGFYLGLQGGAASMNAKKTDADNVSSPEQFGNTNGYVGLIAGYDRGFAECWLAGIEAFGGFDMSKITKRKDDTNGYKLEVKHKNYYGLAVRLGRFIQGRTAAYLRVGGEGGKFEVNDATLAGVVTAKANKNRISAVTGAGMETLLNNNMFIRGQYDYVWGPSIKVNKVSDGTIYENVKNIRQHRIGLGLGYKF